MSNPAFHIKPVRSAEDLTAVTQLFVAYAASIDIDLAYQNFEAELAAMPGKYAPPTGELLLAKDLNGQAIGCVGLRPMSQDDACEIKRLYVSPEGRGMGLGQALAEAIISVASQLGYQEILLDTLPTMTSAIALYKKLGFVPIEPYYDTPVAGTLFLGRSLNAASETNPLPI
ncbi:MAG: acetyltransferase [Vampirovibrio sp.]|nr:acetyltransferase [Vampirovibrio sp.]